MVTITNNLLYCYLNFIDINFLALLQFFVSCFHSINLLQAAKHIILNVLLVLYSTYYYTVHYMYTTKLLHSHLSREARAII